MANNRPLNSDELGDKGERRFSEICTDAKLICNKSERDRTGWDFLVEFPMEDPSGPSSLDTRPAPLSSHFQVKTVWANNDRIKIRLSAAERLAKETRPTFIYVFQVKPDLTFADSFVIHLFDNALAEILTTLRKAHANGKKKINDVFIYLSSKKLGTKIAPSGEALKQFVLNTCGADSTVYASRKDIMLRQIGFEEHRFHGEFSLRYDKDEDLIDAFLGKRSIETTKFSLHEIRFGIPLPQIDRQDSRGRLSIEVSPTDTCKIVFRSNLDNHVASFDAGVFSSPHIFSETIGYKIIIRGDAFEIIHSKLKGKHNTTLTFNSANYTSQEREISEWINYSNFLLILSRGQFSIKIIPKEKKLGQNVIQCSEKLNVEDPQKIEHLLKFLNVAKVVFERASIYGRKIHIDDVVKSRKDLLKLKRIIDGGARLNPFDIDLLPNSVKLLDGTNHFETLMIDFMQVGPIVIGYSCRTELIPKIENDKAAMTSGEILLIDAEELTDLKGAFDRFCDVQKSQSKLIGLMIRHPSP